MSEQGSEHVRFEEWGICDVMGHQRYAGRISEQTIAGSGFIRVDVPEVDEVGYNGRPNGRRVPAFTKLFAPGAIHSITPVSEAIARGVAAKSAQAPVSRFDLPQLAAPAEEPGEQDDGSEDLDHLDELDAEPAGGGG